MVASAAVLFFSNSGTKTYYSHCRDDDYWPKYFSLQLGRFFFFKGVCVWWGEPLYKDNMKNL